VILNAVERARLKTLNFIGDNYEFNQIHILLIAVNKYVITNKKSNFNITFGIGDYETVNLYTHLKFDKNKDERLNKIASSMVVKDLLKKMGGEKIVRYDIPDFFSLEEFSVIQEKIEKESKSLKNINFLNKFYLFDKNVNGYTLKIKEDIYDTKVIIYDILSSIGYERKNKDSDKKKIDNYNNFISQLRKLKNEEAFYYLKIFIELNFETVLENDFKSDWINPYDLYYYKKGNYKSVALFYFYVLKELNFNVKFYILTEMTKKNKDDALVLLTADKEEKEKMKIHYRNVKASYNLSELLYYNPPDLDNSKFLVTLENNGKWIYSYGGFWKDDNIWKSERAVINYARNGCYYSEVENYHNLLNNIPLLEKDIQWDVFYDTK